MCVAAAPAQFGATTLYLGRCRHPEYGRIHVLGYENVAVNFSDGPNAMLLHLPGAGMTQDNFVDTSRSRHILRDMTTVLTPPVFGAYGAPPGAAAGGPPPVQVFEHDIYTVVLAAHAGLIPEALSLVPEHRRIPANRPLFDFYAEQYPDYAIALCCFDNRDAARSDPLLLWYEPLRPDRVELPAIDCHTGGVPAIGTPVPADHWVIVGTDEEPDSWDPTPSMDVEEWRAARMTWSEEVRRSPAGPFLPTHITGRNYVGWYANGDFMIPSVDMMAGRLTAMERVGPGGAPLPPPPPLFPPPSPPPRQGPPGWRRHRWPFGR